MRSPGLWTPGIPFREMKQLTPARFLLHKIANELVANKTKALFDSRVFISFCNATSGGMCAPGLLCSVKVCTHSERLKSQILTVASPLLVTSFPPLQAQAHPTAQATRKNKLHFRNDCGSNEDVDVSDAPGVEVAVGDPVRVTLARHDHLAARHAPQPPRRVVRRGRNHLLPGMQRHPTGDKHVGQPDVTLTPFSCLWPNV